MPQNYHITKLRQPATAREKGLHLLLFVGLLGYAWYLLAISNAQLLYTAQDFNPWLGTDAYWQQMVGHPGGWREWLGGWCTQNFYYPKLGASLLVGCWGLIAWLLLRANRLRGFWAALVFIPIVALLASTTQLGYWIFCLKLPSYWFGPTLGVLAVALVLYLYSLLRRERYRLLVLFVWSLFSLPLLGWYGTLGIVVLLLSTPLRTSLKVWSCRLGMIVLPLTAVALWYHESPSLHWHEPLLLYGWHHFTIPETSTPLLEWPFRILAGSMLLLPLLARLGRRFEKLGVVALLLLIAALAGGNMLNYRNRNYHTELQMLRAMDEGRWDEVIAPMQSLQQMPTREMVLMTDVALAQQGRLGDQGFSFTFTGIRPAMNIDLPIHMAHSASPNIYYWLGLPNYAFMWCQEDNIEYGLSPYFLRMMYRCAIANDELTTASKYRQLLNTLTFHRDYEVSAQETAAVRRFMTRNDEVTNDRGYCEIYLTERLSQEQYDTASEQQLAVHFAMLRRDRLCFARTLARYIELAGSSARLPRHFQEAALLFGLSEGLDIDPEIAARYQSYRQQLETADQMGQSQESIGKLLRPRYGFTYWWYYDFYTFNKTY